MKRFVKLLERVQMTAGVVFLVLFFAIILIQIVTRHLGIAVIWTEEAANYAFIWAVFMGAAVMVNRREHFNFDYFLQRLTGISRVGLSIFNDLVLIVFNIFIFLYGLQVVNEFWNYTWAAIPEMKMGYVWVAIPVMAGSMIIYSVFHLTQHIKSLRLGEVRR